VVVCVFTCARAHRRSLMLVERRFPRPRGFRGSRAAAQSMGTASRPAGASRLQNASKPLCRDSRKDDELPLESCKLNHVSLVRAGCEYAESAKIGAGRIFSLVFLHQSRHRCTLGLMAFKSDEAGALVPMP
jgi:hypothetical protein